MPPDALAINTYTSARYQAPESGFRRMFRSVANMFSSFSSVASLVALFYPPAAAVSAVAQAAGPAVDMVVAGMDQTPPQMMTVTTNQRYLPNWR